MDTKQWTIAVLGVMTAPACEPGGASEIAGEWVAVDTEYDDRPSAQWKLTLDLDRRGTGDYRVFMSGSNGGGNIDFAGDDEGHYRLEFWSWSHLHEQEEEGAFDCTLVDAALVCDRDPGVGWADEFIFGALEWRFERP